MKQRWFKSQLINLLAIRESDLIEETFILPKKNRTIDSLRTVDARMWTRFTKEQLYQLLTYLRIPPVIRINGYVFNQEEMLIVCLTKIAHGESWHVMIPHRFGGNPDIWGGAFGWFINHIFVKFYHKISGDSIGRMWADEANNFRELIWKKLTYSPCELEDWMNGELEELTIVNLPLPHFKPWAFIDCTDVRSSRPGSGPVGEGEHAPRREGAYWLQKAVYSKYFKAHGLKYQAILIPNGLWASIFGGSLNHNDSGILNMSGLREYLYDVLPYIPGTNVLPAVFGDGIYTRCGVITRSPTNPANRRRSCIEEADE